MQTERLYPILKAVIIAGLASGLLLGLFHFMLTEPVIDRAIALEEAAMAPGQASQYLPLVSRGVQKVMLVVGSVLYGLLVGAIFAVLFALLRRSLPGRWPDIKAVALAGLLWWSVALLPFLKYPANPPGVGDSDTIYYRQTIQFSFVVLSALTVVVAGVTYRLLGKQWRNPGLRRPVLTGLLYGILTILLFVLMPPNPDPITAPAELVWDFRIRSLAGQVFFWAVLGVTSALLLKRLARQGVLEKAD